jgi:thiamine pyrophosphokinase
MHEKKARQKPDFSLAERTKLFLLVGRLVDARLAVTLALLRRGWRLCGIGLGGARRDRLLILVAHFMNPFSERLENIFFRYSSEMGTRS